MADALPKLPKLSDYAPEPNSPVVSALRGLSLALAQLGGNPEQAGMLARQFANTDAAKEETARMAFNADLARAQESRMQITTNASLQNEAERMQLARNQEARDVAASQRATEAGARAEADAKLRAAREERMTKLAEREAERQDRADYDSAVSGVRQDLAEYFSKSQTEIRASELLNPILLMQAQAAPTEAERVAGMAQAITEAKGAQLAAAYPGQAPEETAKKISSIIEARAVKVPDSMKAQFHANLAFLVPDSTPAKVAANQPLSEPEWAQYTKNFGLQIGEALTSGRQITPEEMSLLGNTLRLQVAAGMDPKMLVAHLDAAAELATATVIANYGVPPEENETVAANVAFALRNMVEKGEVAALAAPIALRGVGDPAKAQVAAEQAELQLRAAAIREQLMRDPQNTTLARQLAEVEREIAKLPEKTEMFRMQIPVKRGKFSPKL